MYVLQSNCRVQSLNGLTAIIALLNTAQWFGDRLAGTAFERFVKSVEQKVQAEEQVLDFEQREENYLASTICLTYTSVVSTSYAKIENPKDSQVGGKR